MINLRVPDSRSGSSGVLSHPILGDQAHCRRCQVCLQACPAKVMTMTEDQIVIDDRNCIRCYCCQEFCPHDAIELKVPFGGRFI